LLSEPATRSFGVALSSWKVFFHEFYFRYSSESFTFIEKLGGRVDELFRLSALSLVNQDDRFW
jgi:hypothetical protein